jgi:hypothetical protein
MSWATRALHCSCQGAKILVFPWPIGPGNLPKCERAGDRPLQLLVLNEEFLVSVCHQRTLITSLPFVHTARRSYRLNGPVKTAEDWYTIRGNSSEYLPKLTKPYHLEEGEVVTRSP